MPDYNFSQLSPYDFELMCRDLLQAEWGLVLESFKAGKDGGIDFRYAQAGKQIIVQCKRFVETGFAGLLRELRKEGDKVRKLKPSRYVLMTAAPLSDANKTKIVEVIGGQFLVKADIFGCADINNLLGRYSWVERSHYKLWLASTNVLKTILHNDIVTQSDFLVEKIHGEIKRYVQGNAYPRALAALEAEHVVILSGLPGVGKTTLANMLLYKHLANGFEPIIVREDFAEAKAMFQKGKSQVFYFDDFMGTTFLGDKGSSDQQREYRAIIEFIEMVRKAKDKLLILTTREQMLRQACNVSEQIRNAGLMDHRVVIHMDDYSMQQRAEILYNHVFFSDLPFDYRDELLKYEFYFEIVKHRNFNPRLIEWFSTYRRLKEVSVGGYRQFVTQLLEDPAEIWRHAFEQQISEAGRSLLLTLFSFGGRIDEAILREGFAVFHAHRAQTYGFQRCPEDYIRARTELREAFVRATASGEIEVINPSVIDWLNCVLCNVPENAVDLIMGAARFSQISRIWSFVQSAVSGESREALRQNIAQLAPKIGELSTTERATPHVKGGSYLAPSYEKRLATLISMADTLHVAELLPAIEGVIARIEEERSKTFCDIEDTIAALKAYDQVEWEELRCLSPFFKDCVYKIIASAEHDCDLSELLYFLDEYDIPVTQHHPLKTTFENFLTNRLSEEIRSCLSDSHYDRLIEDIEYLGQTIGVDVNHYISLLRTARFNHVEDEEYRLGLDNFIYDVRKSMFINQENDNIIRGIFNNPLYEN